MWTLWCGQHLASAARRLEHAHLQLEAVQAATVLCQLALYKYEGTLRQTLVDDKGFVLIPRKDAAKAGVVGMCRN